MKRVFATVFLVTLAVSGAAAQEHIHKQELKKKLFSEGALIKTGIGALWGEANNSPHEWGRTWEGLGKRVASSYGQRAIKGVVEFSAAEAFTHEDLRYRKSGIDGTLPRIKYALVHTFWVPHDVGYGYTFATGRVTGAFVAGQVARTWMPDRVATFGAGAQRMGFSLALDAGMNVLREFWPHRH
jgi:hypothetical protein